MREEKIELAGLRFSDNRTYGGEGDIKILAEDIKQNGLINPITVKQAPEEVDDGVVCQKIYEVVAGRRRIRAVTMLGWKDIPCRVLEGDEIERADEIAGSENINRLAMHPLDEAAIFQKLLENGEAIEALAKRFDRKASEIWQRVQLLSLNEDIKTLFRKGHLSLHSAAMLKSLDDNSQKEFFKQFKNSWEIRQGSEIGDHQIRDFISSLGHDRLYGFLKDKDCAKCKTRTYFGDKNLFPELDNVSDSCLNHECYMNKWDLRLLNRIKDLKGEHKSHAAASLILTNDDKFQKLMGAKVTIDGIEYKVLPWRWNTEAKAKDKGAQPCFNISTSTSGKLEIKAEYWKEPETYSGPTASPASKKKGFAPVVNLLGLPKAEADEAIEALANRKRLMPQGLGNNVRDAVFWRIMELKAKEFNDPKGHDTVSKEMFLKKHLAYLHGNGKKVFEMFVDKMMPAEIAKLTSDKVFLLLAAMEQREYELSEPEDFAKEKPSEVLKWACIPAEELKRLYQEEIRKRIPKTKAEKKEKPATEKAKPAQGKKPAARKAATKKAAAKKPAPAKGKAKA